MPPSIDELTRFERLDRRSLFARSGSVAATIAGGGLLAPLPAGASATPQSGGEPQTLTIASNWPVIDMDPHSIYEGGSAQAMTGVFEGLIKLRPGKTAEFDPSLAESWESNDDQSVWTFHLRPGVRFHDGTLLDANAVRASFERLLALALAPSLVLGRYIQSVDQITVKDSRTIVFDLGRTQLFFEAAMAAAFGTAIVNAALAKTHEVDGDWGHAWAQTDSTGLGTGPYQAKRSETGDSTELVRFDDYWAGWDGPHFEHVVLRVVGEPETRVELVERGDVDIIINVPLISVDELTQRTDVEVVRQTNLMVQYLAMTVAGPLADPAVRRAICWAFPYEDVLSGVLLGYAKPARGPVNEDCQGFAPTAVIYTTDLDKARRLLDEAGIASGLGLSIAIANGNPENQSIAELFQANLEQIGIDLDIQNLDIAAYVQMAFGDLPADERVSFFPASWGPDYDDACNHLWPMLSCDAWQSGNVGHYCDETVESLLNAARNAGDDVTYEESLAEIQRIATGDDPAGIYFAQPEWITVLRDDIGGYVMNGVVSSLFDYYALYRKEA